MVATKQVARQAEAELIAELHAHRHEAGMGKLTDFLHFMQHRVMLQLTTCSVEDAKRLQGEYAAYKRVFTAVMQGNYQTDQGES